MLELLEEKLSEMKQVGVSPVICERIGDFIENGPLAHMRFISPFRMADTWKLNRFEVLDAFLYGTLSGVFELEWDIKCPYCKGPTSEASTLVQLMAKSRCNMCHIDIDGSLDEAVEVTLRVSSSFRDTSDLTSFEIMGSWMQFEEPITFEVDPQDQQMIKMPLEPGAYHLFNESTWGSTLMVFDEKADFERTVEYTYDGQSLSLQTECQKTGPFAIKLHNQSSSELELTFARAKRFPWVSGATVASNQIFRDYFSSELISPDESFSVKNIVFVFTDIKGSTELYERRGDSKAYYLVKEHFKIMTEVVKKHHGAIVKTIGDAIMATFLSAEDSVKAVFEMQQAFEVFNEREKSRDDIIIKIGVHKGACIAVTSNDKLDYFGRTVNIAARVQGLSGGNDIMLSKTVYDELNIKELVGSYGWKTKPIQANLKGVQGLYDIIHITKPSPL